MPPVVAIVQKSLAHYRVPFFNQLRERLAQKGVELLLIYSDPVGGFMSKEDAGEIAWGRKVPAHIVRIGRYEALWQSCLSDLDEVDLVIVEQASKLLANYWLLLTQRISRRKLAFWGHGQNFRTSAASRLGEWLKRKSSSQVHWWFAYNQMSADIVRETGFPVQRITTVNNAIDTAELARRRDVWLACGEDCIRAATGITTPNVGIYCGSIYPRKKLSFLVAAGDEIRKQVPDFQLIVMGAGPDVALIQQMAKGRPWLRYVGHRLGDDRIPFWLVAKLALIPASVGLVILDAFVLGVPVVTLAGADHGPEIQYAVHNSNSIILKSSTTPAEYAVTVVQYLQEEQLRFRLVAGCQESSLLYSIETMVANFCTGVMAALQAERRRG